MRRVRVMCVISCLALGVPGLATAAGGGWSTTIFAGRFFHDHLTDILGGSVFTERNFMDSHVVTFSVGKELTRWGRVVAWEAEGQFGTHFGYQDHEEFNAALVARWLPFPWDGVVNTSFAIGEGLSYASERPYTEGVFRNRTGRHYLNYLFVELDFSLPNVPAWSLVSRVHHRSGVFGVYGTREGSNFVGFGLRRRF